MTIAFTPRPERTENDVEYNIVGWLRSMGWIAERNPVGQLFTRDGRPHPVGRRGACDWRFKRGAQHQLHYMEIEAKAPGRKPDRHQVEYMAAMKHVGVVAVWFDSLVALQDWYRVAIHSESHTDAAV